MVYRTSSLLKWLVSSYVSNRCLPPVFDEDLFLFWSLRFIVAWNDYGESHYIGPRPDSTQLQPSTTTWVSSRLSAGILWLWCRRTKALNIFHSNLYRSTRPTIYPGRESPKHILRSTRLAKWSSVHRIWSFGNIDNIRKMRSLLMTPFLDLLTLTGSRMK